MHRGTGKFVARISFIDLNAIKMVLHTIDDLVMRAQRVGILPRPRAIVIVYELATDQSPAL